MDEQAVGKQVSIYLARLAALLLGIFSYRLLQASTVGKYVLVQFSWCNVPLWINRRRSLDQPGVQKL